MPIARPLVKALARGLSYPLMGRGGTAYYVDPSIAGGNGLSPATAWDDFTEVNALTGDLGGAQILLKAGSTIVDCLQIDGASNYTIGMYGSGANPIIDGGTTLASSWAADGTWAGDSDDVYSFSGWTRGDVPVTYNGHQCERRTSKADMALVYASNDVGYSTWPFTQYYDSGATTMYIHIPDASASPNTRTKVSDNNFFAALHVLNGSNVIIQDIDATNGSQSCIRVEEVNDVTIRRVNTVNGGEDGGISIIGNSKASKNTNASLTDFTVRRNHTANGNGVEMWWYDGVTISDGEIYDVSNNSIEMWESSSNVTVERVKARNSENFIEWIAGSVDQNNVLYTNHLIRNCEVVQRATYLYHDTAGTTGAGGRGFNLKRFDSGTVVKFLTNVRIVQNSIDTDGSPAYDFTVGADTGLGANTLTFKNNFCRLSRLTNSAVHVGNLPNTAGRCEGMVFDYNTYQFGNDGSNNQRWFIQANNAYGIGDLRAYWNGVTGATTNEDNSTQLASTAQSVVTGGGTITSTNLEPVAGSELSTSVDTGDADWSTTDIEGVTRSINGGGSYNIPAPAYQFALTDAADDGQWSVNGSAWSSTGCSISDGGGSFDIYAAWSFPSTGLTQGQTISRAVLRVRVDTGATRQLGGSRFYGESNASAASAQWSGVNNPGAATAVASTVDLAIVGGDSGYKTLDVTTMVNQILAGASYAGGRINIWARPINADNDVIVSFYDDGNADSARLTITT